METEPKKKRGRPAKPKDERKDMNLTFRVAPELREILLLEALDAGRSVSAEIEYALCDYYKQKYRVPDLAYLISVAVHFAEVKLGRPCFSDKESERMCRVAAETALAIAFGDRSSLEAEWDSLAAQLAEAIETGGPSETKAILSAKTEAILDEMKRTIDSFREEALMAHSVATNMWKMLIKRRDLDVIDPLRGRVLDLVDRLSQQPQKEEPRP